MLETERLWLRPPTEADKDWNYEQSSCPVTMRHLGGPMSRETADARIDKLVSLYAERGLTFGVMELKPTHERIGLCGLKLFDAEGATLPGEIELGYRLAPAWWGKGYAKEAATAALDYAFTRVNAPRVVALTSEANAASWGLMRRLGMTRRPDLDFNDPRFPGEPTILHVIEREEWRPGG